MCSKAVPLYLHYGARAAHLAQLRGKLRAGVADRRAQLLARVLVDVVVDGRHGADKLLALGAVGADAPVHALVLLLEVEARVAAPPWQPSPRRLADHSAAARGQRDARAALRRQRRLLEQALGRGDVVDAQVERARDQQRRLVELVGGAEQVVLLERAPGELATGGRLRRRRPPLAPLSQLAVVVCCEAGSESRERRQQQLRLQVGHATRPLGEAGAEELRIARLPLDPRPEVVRDVVRERRAQAQVEVRPHVEPAGHKVRAERAELGEAVHPRDAVVNARTHRDAQPRQLPRRPSGYTQRSA